jgi:hypothetical protein
LAERKLRQAIDEGLFEKLAGHGRPLEIPEDDLVPEEWRTAFRLLKSSGHLPAWLDLRKEAETRLEAATEDLRRAARGPVGFREHARERFCRDIDEINRLIVQANLRVRHPGLQTPQLHPGPMADRILREASLSDQASDGSSIAPR